MCGYSLLDTNPRQVMFILYGKGRNGKSKTIEVLARILDNYAVNIAAESLVAKRFENARSDLVTARTGWRISTTALPDSAATVMNINDHARKRLLDLAEQDAGKDRMIYRLYVTSRIEDDGSRDTRVHDVVDPEFERIDHGIAGRVADVRREVERVLKLKR
jgi:hypothetical protein